MRRAATLALVLVTGCLGQIGGGGDGGGEPTPDPTARCETSRVGPPMLRRLTRDELQHTVLDAFPMLPASWQGLQMGPDPLSSLGFGNDGSTLVVSNQVLREVGRSAEEVAGLLVEDGRLGQLLPCAAQNPGAACADELVERYGHRLFRRPLTGAERGEYRDYFASVEGRSDFRTAVKWTLVALIQSPNTLYRSELGQPAGADRELTRQEIASALSYTFGGSPPSEELLARAERGELDSPEARVAEARALLQTPRGRAIVRRFFREWSGYGRVETQVRPEVAGFEPVRPAMVAETEAFIDEVVTTRGGGVFDLLTADYTVIDDAGLAAFYGFGGSGLIQRPPEWGLGLLAQGSILAGRAHAEASSPTLRGLFVIERLLCRERPPLPPNVPPIPAAMPGASTTRERYEQQHAGNEFCAGCHELFDPVGFAFEHFDAAGRYRADEHGLAIDATGMVVSLEDRTPIMEFDGLTDLAQQLADTPLVTDCVSGLLTYFTYGGGGGEICLAEDARTALANGDIGLLEFMARLAAEPHFTRRR